ncbi:hypothetical protein ACOME3_008663 [Neoechinorhynchus agilis]
MVRAIKKERLAKISKLILRLRVAYDSLPATSENLSDQRTTISPPVSSVVCSLNSTCSKRYSRCFMQSLRQELVTCLTMCIAEAIITMAAKYQHPLLLFTATESATASSETSG